MPITYTIEKTIYHFDELSDAAKERARDWWRSDYDYFEPDLDDFECVAEILGIEFATCEVPLCGGGTRKQSRIYWSGFGSQGDGACFEGCYRYAPGAAKRIREYAPQDRVLHRIADALQDVQRRAFYGLSARTAQRGHYCNSGCMSVTVDHNSCRWPTGEEEEAIADAMRNFADWMYNRLKEDFEWSTADEQVDEAIRANEYTFDASGRRED